MEELHYVSGFNYSRDVTYFDFINRLYSGELAARAAGVWLVPHPWLMLFVPKSKVLEFDSRVFKGVLKDSSGAGSMMLYPMNRSK
jgi:cytokinin dehydrogenase